jgi:adenylylsulfate kinase
MANVFPFRSKVSREQRELVLNQRGLLIWFTGLSGSGKSSLAVQLEVMLHQQGFKTFLLDGDIVRSGICSDLEFDAAGREENMRRIGEIAKLLLETGLVIIASFISPFKKDREQMKAKVGSENYFEVFVDCPVEVCEIRDTKGLYKRARKGEIKDFTGVSSPYEIPESPDLIIPSSEMPIEESINLLLKSVVPRVVKSRQ